MADQIDIASSIIEKNLEHSISNVRRVEFTSALECEECGEDIPEQRRKLGSISRCVECQSVLESQQKHQHRTFF